jgi:hypothetical protein
MFPSSMSLYDTIGTDETNVQPKGSIENNERRWRDDCQTEG